MWRLNKKEQPMIEVFSPLFLASVQITKYFRIGHDKRNYNFSVTTLVLFPPLLRKYTGLTTILIVRQ